MGQNEYLNFDLLIERNEEGYYARVVDSPGGEVAERFEEAFTAEELESFLVCLGRPGQAAETFAAAAEDFGGRLFDAVFKDEIYACLLVSLEEARDQDKGLRILLRLRDVPDLAALPWEYLYNPNLGFLSCSPDTPVVRYLELPKRVRPLTIKLPLRVLVMISSPGDYPRLDVDKEWAKLSESFADLRRQGLVELELLEEATESRLQEHLRRKVYHVFHFIGHGGYDKDTGDGFLILEDEENRGRRINGQRLAALLRNRSALRLVLLNACDGARASLSDPFGGTAQSLVRAGIPAVIAMQFEISDRAAIAFANEFYKALADYCPVDTALGYARIAMSESEWGTPALYMRSHDGCLFTAEPQPPPPDPWRDPKPDNIDNAVNPNEVYYRGMVNAIKGGSLVFFVGAGANLCGRMFGDWQGGPYAPSDGELAAHLSGIRPLPDNLRDLVRVSQYIALEDVKVLNSELHSVFTRPFLTTSLHKFLATLPRVLKDNGCARCHQLIVTTNYDSVLERAFDAEQEPYDLVCYIAGGEHSGKFYHKPYRADPLIITEANQYDAVSLDTRSIILKIHGAVDQADSSHDSYIITEDNYIDHLTRADFINLLPVNIPAKLRDNNSNFMFLGYRLRDWNLRILFRRIWGEEGPKSNSWALGLDSDPVDIEFWKKRNVKILRDVSLEHYVEEMNRRLKG
ncbi:MAG: CHAT domain-containing protein [Blastocatellia bacterium]